MSFSINPVSVDVGCRNSRRVCAAYCNKTSGFEVVHGLLDRLMHVLEVAYEENAKPDGLAYHLREVDGTPPLPHKIELYVSAFC